jgi:hypothetical protein
MTEEEAQAAGARAEMALTVLDPAMDRVKEAILAELVATSPQHSEKILALHRAVQNVDATRAAILDVVNNGKIAAVAIASAGLTRTS